MARNPKVMKKKSPERPRRASAATGRPRRGRPKICIFCAERATWVDYKDVGLLKRFVNDRGRIKARGATGTCAQHQRDVAVAIKCARELALLPYSVRTAATDQRGGRGDRGPRPSPTPDIKAEAEEAVAAPDVEVDAVDDVSDAADDAAEVVDDSDPADS